jgi:hypothetical protein
MSHSRPRGTEHIVSDAQVGETDYVAFTEADKRHRDHAVVEHVIAELKDGPLAHLPSGKYAATAAWLALAVTAFNARVLVALACGAGQPPPEPCAYS